MENRIEKALKKLFERHRIIFWNDTKRELRKDFDEVKLTDIEKFELKNNEFALKYRVLREQPQQKFLIYREGPQPPEIENWLLDLQLAYGIFRTDQVAIWLSELELGLEFVDLLQAHSEFFQSLKRKEAFKSLIDSKDTPGMLRLKMIVVCVGAEPQMEAIMESLLEEVAQGQNDKAKLIDRCNLAGYLWEQMTRIYGYKSDEPSIKDFVIELFKSCYGMGTDGQVSLSSDALVFLKRWKDSRKYERSFETLSDECAEILSIETDLTKRDFRKLVELDYFRLIDLKIISDLVQGVVSRTISTNDVTAWVRHRRQCHWFQHYSHLYEAIDYAAQFVHTLDGMTLNMDSFADGVQLYSHRWYILDQLYRKFTFNARQSGQSSLLASLNDLIENLYTNNYLLKLNDRWQFFIDSTLQWKTTTIPLLSEFFIRWVKPFLNKDNKVSVIISDAMRYEIGDELLSLINKEDRYDSNLETAISMVPSYTQLGMAALLPHGEFKFAENDYGHVLVDNQPSTGTVNRNKILQNNKEKKQVKALKASELLGLNKEDCRALVRDNDIVYVYHNRIDSTGDKIPTEEFVFQAVEEAMKDLIQIIKKLAGANATNLLVTSDHGFIYQNRAIEESDFCSSDPEGEQILYRDRRFVLGKGLKENSGFKKFTSSQLGLVGEMEVLIPKSIKRIRLSGSGSRYVHGGTSLQELMIPVLKINKKRQSDVSTVEVDIIRSSSSVITSGQLAVVFYQNLAVTDKVQPRILRAGIYTMKGVLISDSHNLNFDLTSENARDREIHVRFLLTSKSDSANGQEVILRLDQKHKATTHYQEYKSARYLMRRSFTSDFEL